MKQIRKSQLPSKICVVCNRPFQWRRKWKKSWPDVKYCSEKCQRQRTLNQRPAKQLGD